MAQTSRSSPAIGGAVPTQFKFYAELSQSEIAARLGISQMHVSRLQRSALGKLKQSLVGS